jgi:2-oxoglutarate/2-oxoacid ferredoxin oxidoreductase subunit beta
MTTQTFPLDELKPLTRKDFVTDQEVRWCPGCGDYSILAQMQKVMPELGVRRENIVVISGIGCSSRAPYYLETYGFHSIHGRALTLATGLKSTRPELSVWVVTGDGDGLSIGGNHLLHAMRRNLDINVILFNNRIYGLTKGQYSPTSEFGKITKSSPMGTIDVPLDPIRVALAAEATFVARSLDVDTAHLQYVLKRAADHHGTSFVEVYQNCNIFNDGAFKGFTDREVRDDRVLYLEDGKPMRYGKEKQHGLRLNGFELETVENAGEDAGILVHDEKADRALATILARIGYPEYPVPVGVFHAEERPTLEELMAAQIADAKGRGEGNLEKLLNSGETWVVD